MLNVRSNCVPIETWSMNMTEPATTRICHDASLRAPGPCRNKQRHWGVSLGYSSSATGCPVLVYLTISLGNSGSSGGVTAPDYIYPGAATHGRWHHRGFSKHDRWPSFHSGRRSCFENVSQTLSLDIVSIYDHTPRNKTYPLTPHSHPLSSSSMNPPLGRNRQ